MYAIIESGNKQYKVNKGDIIDVELLSKSPEEKIVFDKVLLISADDKIEIGMPYLTQAKVEAKVLKEYKDKKVISYKYRHKTNYHKKKGHRQNYTQVVIEEVSL
ncbi:MAG: large subunit ribosomal protein L21 [Candidatus Saganbacteria bacterium]|uniref:Large ribosomal subunit protein bL21 n=1 Tax=Candidatus Saganbacteria bacterium TaxID=2575572 RepID=A0A833L1D6_UNCSA|nr:MAG: large subunit ribosomal protein L21 [Candidatus Saganbacteria bacterium]